MKSYWIFIPIVFTLLFVVFVGGFYVGRNINHVPVRVESGIKATTPSTTQSSDDQQTTAPSPGASLRVNINTATLSELTTVPGIGEVLAQRIIDYRTQHGDFKSVNDLLNVDGIGEKTLSNMIDYITVGG